MALSLTGLSLQPEPSASLHEAAVQKLMVKARKARGRKRAPTAPAQGTLFWAKHTVYDDGTHEFNIPAVRDAIGGGNNRVEALQDVSIKVAVLVVTSITEGSIRDGSTL